jgi:succinate dehydrogenase / fumarate reductase, cytochrome b subunit
MANNTAHPRPVFRNIHITEIVSYRLPPAGWVSILHRVSGALLFLLLPFIIWMFDASVSSEISYGGFTAVFSGWFVKLVALALIWAYLFHFIAGVRHLWMDMTHSVTSNQGRISALVTLIASGLLTVVLGVKLFLS